MAEPDEFQNKTWLTCAKGWLERERHESFSAEFTSPQLNLLDEFLEKEISLSKYLELLDNWLIRYGIKSALKELPSVGMLLSQLCKVKIVMISDLVSKKLFNCIIHLSDLSNPSKAEDTATKRAQKWAIDYFLKMIDVDVDEVDLFLMEEFGVSSEEYLKEQIKQASLHLRNRLQHPSKFLSKVNICFNSLFEFCKLVDSTLLMTLCEAIIYNISNITYKTDSQKEMTEKQLKWICQNKNLMQEFPLESLLRLFCSSLSTFEHYILSIVKGIVDKYPGIDREVIRTDLIESRLIELCRVDMRYYLAILQVLKESFLVIGLHHGLMELFRVFMELCRPFSSCAHVYFDTSLDVLNGVYVNSPKGLTVNACEDQLRRLHEKLVSHHSKEIEEENSPCDEFEFWWSNLKYACWADEAVQLLLDGLRQNVAKYLHIFIHFFFPTEFSGMMSHLQILTTYVYALRNLLQKKHIQLSDVEFLLSSFQRKLPPYDDFVSAHVLLVILGVLFVAKSSGISMTVGDKYLENLIANDSNSNKQNALYWFLYTVQLLLRPSVLSQRPPSNIINPIFKAIVKNRLYSIVQRDKIDKNDKIDDNSSCMIDLTMDENSPELIDDVTTSVVKEESGLYTTICTLIEKLEES